METHTTDSARTLRILLLDDDTHILDMYKLILPRLLPAHSFTITDIDNYFDQKK